jgi:hypothetical protein
MTTISLATATLLVISGSLALRATLIPIRDSIDDFIADINRQARWASAGAACALGVAALELAKLFL